MIERPGVRFNRHRAVRQQGFDFRSKEEAVTANEIKQRLLPKTIPRQEQGLRMGVPNRKGKHAAQPSQTMASILLIGMHNDFRVTIRAKLVAAGFQVST